jgi:hypothetical protein
MDTFLRLLVLLGVGMQRFDQGFQSARIELLKAHGSGRSRRQSRCEGRRSACERDGKELQCRVILGGWQL